MAETVKTRRRSSSNSRSNSEGPAYTFGADFIPFDAEFRTGEIPGKRKRDHSVDDEQATRQSRRARYEDGTFTTPWMARMDHETPKDPAAFFHREIRAFADYIIPTETEHALRGLIVREIEYYARKIWPDATATAFGSYATGLYLPTGDIDVVIETKYATASTKNAAQRALSQLATILRSAGLAERRKIQVISARVSIIKFDSVHGGIPVDISLNQTTGVSAIPVINRYLEHFPALRPLIMVVKAFLNQRGMNEVYKGGLGSYSIICLAISFLQMHPKVRLGEIDPSDNLGVLLVEFFEFYGFYFNYNLVGISLNQGGSYFLKMQRGWHDMSKPWLLSIADPTDETNDVSRGSFQMLRLKQTLGGAALILKARLIEISEQMRSHQDGYYFSLRGQPQPQALDTVLGRLLAMSPEAISRRQRIEDVFYSGRIHRTLELPLPSALPANHPKSDSEDESDMQISDSSPRRSTAQVVKYIKKEPSPQKTSHVSNIKETNSGSEDSEDFTKRSDGDEPEEESRYTHLDVHSTRKGRPRDLNRFEPLEIRRVEYIMTDSEADDPDEHEDGRASPVAHANKKRQIEPEPRKPDSTRKESKRAFWASKAGTEKSEDVGL